jgi:SpoVK/Ycf46/Vps4 family AAA+-type ATPase
LVEEDIKQFFDNVDYYTRFSQPGSRRMLLVGEPGGGKTSAAMLIAQEYSKRMCVVIATDLKAVMMHTYNVSKAKMPTLIILEDAESTIPWSDSGILNYLDGINQPKTEKGCYSIFTTNHPKRIEPRILKRPGRIDKVVKFGALDEINSILCVKHYFDGILFDSKKDKPKVVEEVLKQVYDKIILDKDGGTMTGAQIKNLSEAIMSYAVSKKVEKITVDTLKSVVETLNKDLQEVYDMADEESISKERMTPVGFEINNNSRKSSQGLDWNEIMNPKTSKSGNGPNKDLPF